MNDYELAVAETICPVCDALPGVSCFFMSTGAMRKTPHRDRVLVWREALRYTEDDVADPRPKPREWTIQCPRCYASVGYTCIEGEANPRAVDWVHQLRTWQLEVTP